MRLENAFEVPASPEDVWRFMLDVERVAPCMPGAELTEVVDDHTWKGKVTVKLGPVSLSYTGTVVMEEKDEQERRAVLKAEGRETKGKGTATALVTSQLQAADGGGTRVGIVADLTLSGAVAQFGRGMIGDVSQRLTDQFAECLRATLAAEPGAPAPRAKPVAGIRLGIWAVLRAIGRFFVRAGRAITGRGSGRGDSRD